MPLQIGDKVYAKKCVDDGYHQGIIEMVIDNGRQYLVSWLNQNRHDTLVWSNCTDQIGQTSDKLELHLELNLLKGDPGVRF